MASDDLGERTEDATPRRKSDARNAGNVARSQDLAGAIVLLSATLMAAVALFLLIRVRIRFGRGLTRIAL